MNYCSWNKWLIGLTDDYAIFWDEKKVKPEISDALLMAEAYEFGHQMSRIKYLLQNGDDFPLVRKYLQQNG